MEESYSIKTMTDADIDQAVEWAAAEGWNPGIADARCFATIDPEGFIGGWLGDRMIASISVVNYGPDFSFLGFYIVDAPYRGRGYGYRLWRHAIQHAGQRLIGLDGVVAEQDNYRRSGFELAYRNVRYEGSLPTDLNLGHADGPSAVDLEPLDRLTPELIAFDRTAFPAPRDVFLRSWISAPGHLTRAAYRDGTLIGYGVSRPCRIGRKIGPLFAEDRQVAEMLLSALLSGSGAEDEPETIFLDVPEPNQAAVTLARDLGLRPVFETARMYTGPAPAVDLRKVFGVTSFELG